MFKNRILGVEIALLLEANGLSSSALQSTSVISIIITLVVLETEEPKARNLDLVEFDDFYTVLSIFFTLQGIHEARGLWPWSSYPSP